MSGKYIPSEEQSGKKVKNAEKGHKTHQRHDGKYNDFQEERREGEEKGRVFGR